MRNTRIVALRFIKIVLFFCVAGAAGLSAPAQPAPPASAGYQALSSAQLDQLLGPLALYPDPLLAQILPAATFPAQIAAANQYIAGGGDPNQIAQQPWDPSVQGVAHYPPVLKWMSDNPNVTVALGQAFLNQQDDVMASVQRLRGKAASLGNLQSTPQQEVDTDGGDIAIDPANPNEMYVPSYQPDQVYSQSPNGSSFIVFGADYPIGLWLDNDFDWRNRNLIVWSRAHPRPANWWHEPAARRSFAQAAVWRGAPAPVNRGDRGWAVPARPVAVPERAPVQPAVRVEASGALIGVRSVADTKNYSARGQQSMRAAHPAPAERPAPSSEEKRR